MLKKFPIILQWVKEIREKSVLDNRYPYEKNLIQYASFLIQIPILFEEKNHYHSGTVHGFENFGQIIFKVELDQDLEGQEKIKVIGHEIGHILLAYRNILLIRDKGNFYWKSSKRERVRLKDDGYYYLLTRVINPNTGKEFSIKWYQKWAKKYQLSAYNLSRSNPNVAEILCEEIGSYLTGGENRASVLDKNSTHQLVLDL